MRLSSTLIRRAVPAYYGWRIVVFAAVGLALTGPGQTLGVSVFVDPMIDGLGLTRTAVSTAYLVATLTGALALPLVGQAIDRFGVRAVMVLVAAAFGAALLGMSQVAGLLTLVAGFTGIRMFGQGSLALVSTTSVALWFERRRGLAVGTTIAAGMLGMSLTPVVLAQLLGLLGWRGAWVAAGVTVWAIVLPVAAFGMRDSPASIGEHVDGEAPASTSGPTTPAAAPSATRAEAMRTLMFWALTAAVATTGMIGTGLVFHQVSLLGEQGLTVTQAAANFLPQTAAAVLATLLMGMLVDRFSARVLVAASMGVLAFALLFVPLVAPGWPAVLYALALGTSIGAVRAQEAAVFPRYFGTGHLGAIRGVVMALNVGATALGPWVLALGYAQAGSYRPALTALVALPAAVALLVAVAPVPGADRPARRRPGAPTTKGEGDDRDRSA